MFGTPSADAVARTAGTDAREALLEVGQRERDGSDRSRRAVAMRGAGSRTRRLVVGLGRRSAPRATSRPGTMRSRTSRGIRSTSTTASKNVVGVAASPLQLVGRVDAARPRRRCPSAAPSGASARRHRSPRSARRPGRPRSRPSRAELTGADQDADRAGRRGRARRGPRPGTAKGTPSGRDEPDDQAAPDSRKPAHLAVQHRFPLPCRRGEEVLSIRLRAFQERAPAGSSRWPHQPVREEPDMTITDAAHPDPLRARRLRPLQGRPQGHPQRDVLAHRVGRERRPQRPLRPRRR